MDQHEYLIQPGNGAGWISVPVDDLARIMAPCGWEATPASGRGNRQVRVGATELSLTAEPSCWQVSIPGPVEPSRADGLVRTMADQLSRYSGEPVTWTRVPDQR